MTRPFRTGRAFLIQSRLGCPPGSSGDTALAEWNTLQSSQAGLLCLLWAVFSATPPKTSTVFLRP